MRISGWTGYSIKAYILIIALATTISLWLGVAMYSLLAYLLGFDCQGVIRLVIMAFPVIIFAALYGFYKGLVKYYGLKGDKNLFFGGKF
jgi:hypothetical protein